ncbi:MAG: (Fe-S)-binding protein [Deltaproteobacteria bacterium]|nr:(Fe-S)-binding protein [Deltaproteobacteria bacterium]
MSGHAPTTVTLFIPCLMDGLFPQAAGDLVYLLRRLGFRLAYPPEQTCCGQPAFNQGYFEPARKLARRFIELFEPAECIVCPSGSCTAMVKKHYEELFVQEPGFLERAQALGEKIFEVSQFLTAYVPLEKINARFPGKVTYHDSCHSARGLGIFAETRRLLARVQGLELVEMEDSKACCGFGGLFSRRFPEVSAAIGMEKIKQIQATGADWVIGNDPGCLMQIQGQLHRQALPIGVKHLVEVLAGRGRENKDEHRISNIQRPTSN